MHNNDAGAEMPSYRFSVRISVCLPNKVSSFLLLDEFGGSHTSVCRHNKGRKKVICTVCGYLYFPLMLVVNFSHVFEDFLRR